MAKKHIDFISPSMPNALLVMVDYLKIVRSNRYTNFGPFENEFRKNILSFCEEPNAYSVTVSSATLGLQIAVQNTFKTSKNHPYVLLPSFTFAASACVLKNLGYNLAFYDINEQTLQPDLNSAKNISKSIKGKIAGIVYCNTLGIGDKENIISWSKSFPNTPIIVDSAAGFGSKYEDGSYLGFMGECEIFSFHATKTMAIGEGGLILTKNRELANRMKASSNFGFNDLGESFVSGTNAKLQEMNAAIGIKQLKRLKRINLKKHKQYLLYKKLLDNRFTIVPGTERSSNAFLSIICSSELVRNKSMESLKSLSIPSRKYYFPLLHNQKAFKEDSHSSSLKNTIQTSKSIISIPIHSKLRKKEIELISNTLNQVL